MGNAYNNNNDTTTNNNDNNIIKIIRRVVVAQSVGDWAKEWRVLASSPRLGLGLQDREGVLVLGEGVRTPSEHYPNCSHKALQ